MSENRTGKYLKYAIGEIILVVIGILIALQINNWNQAKKNRAYELTMLKQVKEQLNTDYLMCKNTLPYFEAIIHSINEVAKIKNESSISSDSLQYHMDKIRGFGISYSFNTSAYNSIESGGLNKISNPEIRDLISDLYGNSIPTAEAWVNEIIREVLYKRGNLINEIFKPVVVPGENNQISSVINFDDPDMIRNNSKVDELLMELNWPMPITIRLLKGLLVKMERLMSLIDEELE